MKGRAAHGGRYAGWRFLAGGLAALAATLIPAGVASAATVSDSASVTVSLDSPGTVTLDGFDPARGRLTSVAVSLRADVVVQVCIENTATTPAAMGAGTATASLTAEFPGGANRTVGAVDAAVAAGNLAASNGTADCAGAFDAVTGRFPAAVTVGDAAYVERAGQAVTGTVLTSSEAMAPFMRAGTVTVTYTAQSDTELALPPAWDNTSVAQGQLPRLCHLHVYPGIRRRRVPAPVHRLAEQPDRHRCRHHRARRCRRGVCRQTPACARTVPPASPV